MLKASIPVRFQKPWAANAAGAYIRTVPVASQIGIQDGAASFTDGFVPSNFTALSGGGVPPFGQDFNGILNAETSWDQWYQAGGIIPYDSTFATAIGGYPLGACVPSSIFSGDFWLSNTENNLIDPDTLGQTAWIFDPSRLSPGTPVPSFSSVVPPGLIAANSLTIGNVGSNASTAALYVKLLYRFIWFTFSNTDCPIFTSGGIPTTRGANPDADFAALKQLSTPDLRGRGLIGVDTMAGPTTTRLAGVPIVSGNTTSPGSVIGENLHALSTAELAAHSHANTVTNGSHTHVNSLSDPGHFHTATTNAQADLSNASAQNGGGFTSSTPQIAGVTIAPAATGLTINNAAAASAVTITNVNAGSGTPHNTVSQNVGVYWNLKV